MPGKVYQRLEGCASGIAAEKGQTFGSAAKRVERWASAAAEEVALHALGRGAPLELALSLPKGVPL
jgi:hypothetical protein